MVLFYIIWKAHEYVEVGTLEIAAMNAHTERDSRYTNAQINNHGGRTFSTKDYKAIIDIDISVLGSLDLFL